jgi:demethoxyubiquinone hydroxylase (CLK1/Coq7/Cat5 family)
MAPEPGAGQRSLAGLTGILRLAYSGELAAGLAYRGHWRSVTDPEEREHIRCIEDEEWDHRRLVGEMLAALGARPSRLREARARAVGWSLGLLCHVAGWFAPMYAAGRLESRNIREYEDAARFAEGSGHPELVDCLLTMAEVEWEHERYFRSKVEGRTLTRLLGLWPEPPPKHTIRAGRGAAPALARSVA